MHLGRKGGLESSSEGGWRSMVSTDNRDVVVVDIRARYEVTEMKTGADR